VRKSVGRFLDIILPFVDILFVKKEDYNLLFEEENDEEKILSKLQKSYGKEKIYILTQGEEGCSVLFKDEYFSQQAYNTDVVDRIGAGDAFVAGFLYGYLTGKTLKESAKYGSLLASIKMSLFGDFPTLDRKTLLELLESENNRSVER